MGIGSTNYPTSLDSVSDLVEAKNNASTTLTSSLASNSTNVSVVSTSGFPFNGGIIRINNEIIAYTQISTSPHMFSGLTRGFEGTVATSHNLGDTVSLDITAASNNVKNDAIIALESKVGVTSSTPTNRTVLRGGTTAGTSSWEQIEYDISLHAEYTIAANQVLLRFVAPRAFTIPSGNFFGRASIGPTANRDFLVQKNGSTFATLRFASGSTTLSIVSSTSTNFAANDLLSILGPSTSDTNLSGVSITLAGLIRG